MLFVPIWDMNHLKRVRFQYVTVGLIVLNTLIYFVFGTHLFLHSPASFVDALAFKPREVTSIHDFMEHVPEQFRLLTYMFMHGSVWHLLGNMVFLFVFGDNIEDAMGHISYLLFYLLCGIAAGLTQIALNPTSTIPMIGASGAISVMGAYIVLFPRGNVRALFGYYVTLVPAWVMIGIWFAVQLFSGVMSLGLAADTGGVAFWAHVGGFAAGVILVFLFRDKEAVERQKAVREQSAAWQRVPGYRRPSVRRGPF